MQKRDKEKINDNTEFNKKLRALKKYCPQSYKFFIFNIKNKISNVIDGDYEINLPTSDEFMFIYGQIKLKYSINDGKIKYKDLEPSQFFLDGYKFDLDVYKNIYYRNQKDKFKINLMTEIKKKGILLWMKN